MRLHWVRTRRLPRPPVWAVVLVGTWLLLVLMGVLLERAGVAVGETCLLQRLTQHPCPTCGSTRVLLGLAEGDWRGALRVNPLVALGLDAGLLWLGVRLVSGRVPRFECSRLERHLLLALGVVILLANWVWVLRVQA